MDPRVFDSHGPTLVGHGALDALHLAAKAVEVQPETDRGRDAALQVPAQTFEENVPRLRNGT